MSKASDKPIKFEQAIEQLETIIQQIESGEAGLEECLMRYEQGMKLITQCRAILTAAEHKITELSVTAKGGLADQGEVAGDVPAGQE